MSATKNVVRTSTENVQKSTKVINTTKKGLSIAPPPTKEVKEVKQPLYLKEGIKGKSLMGAKIGTNNAHKSDSKSFSFCLKRVIQFDKGFLESFVNYKESDLTPKNLLPLRNELEAQKETFSVWLIMQLITRYYKNM